MKVSNVSEAPPQHDYYLDALDLCCPMPLLKLKAILHELPRGKVVKMVTKDSGALTDIPLFAKHSHECSLIAQETDQNAYAFWVVNS